MQVDVRAVQARRERTLREQLEGDWGVGKARTRIRELTHGRGYGYRRSLLSRALRLTRSMSPEVADTIAECREMLGLEHAIEVYVRPESDFNASCFREDHGPVVLTITSRLLEDFAPAELRFVIGHELGHAALDHYGIPMPITATLTESGAPYVTRETALNLYLWCRSAEVSADRIGLLLARDPEAAARGFFKLASGVASDRVQPDLQAFARQIDSLAAAPEAREQPRDDDDTLDCFSTHPYNPVRVRAVWAFSRSEPYLRALGRDTTGALTLDQVEDIVERDLALMAPTYLQEKSNDSDVLRRLLYTAGVAVAAASGRIEKSELEALGKLLGSDHGEVVTDVEAALRNLAPRLEAALSVPLASRAQLVQHLAIVALADGGVQNEELVVMEDVATRLQVDPRIIHQTIHGALHPID
ncbi:MAG: M48 family metallopeptidase [Bradymonadia bacterium]|jgi:tellurite resistance protein